MPPRRFSDLRKSEPLPAKEGIDTIEQVVGRLAGTADGRMLLAWMREEVRAACHPAASDATLREAEGVRAFVGRLLDMIT